MLNPNGEVLRKVTVTIVTYNSRRYIVRCLDTLLAQEGVRLEVIVVDNASTDGTPDLLRRYGRQIRLIRNPVNTGFAAAQNQAIAAGDGAWVLTLNPDVLVAPGFIRAMVEAGTADDSIGTVCGRLLAIGPDFTPLAEPRLDSTGIYFTPEMRHFDRGWGEPDDGRYGRREYVFGASAAAALYRRQMIDDVGVPGGFFDPDFFAYREDADVAFRAQLMGWRCLYVPEAIAEHVRSVVPGPRHRNPALLNMHSVKNRFLMRIKVCTPGLFARFWRAMMLRDLLVVGGCFVTEPKSVPAFWHLARLAGRALSRRRWIMQHRRVDDDAIARWMSGQAGSPAEEAVPIEACLNGQAGD